MGSSSSKPFTRLISNILRRALEDGATNIESFFPRPKCNRADFTVRKRVIAVPQWVNACTDAELDLDREVKYEAALHLERNIAVFIQTKDRKTSTAIVDSPQTPASGPPIACLIARMHPSPRSRPTDPDSKDS